MRGDEIGPERAVQPHRKRAGVGDRIPHRLDLLGGDHGLPAASDGSGNNDGIFDAIGIIDLTQGDEGGFGIERIEDGLDHHDVAAAGDEGTDLVAVGLFDLIESDDTEAGILGIG